MTNRPMKFKYTFPTGTVYASSEDSEENFSGQHTGQKDIEGKDNPLLIKENLLTAQATEHTRRPALISVVRMIRRNNLRWAELNGSLKFNLFGTT